MVESNEHRIRARAEELGFDAVGVAAADAAIDRDFERYARFVDAGMHGTMAWVAEHREVRRRVDTADVLLGARSIVCVAGRYVTDAAPTEGVTAGIARYARGQDYHNRMRKQLRKLAVMIRGLGDGVAARPISDTAPVLDRAWAARAGLGFVGKNGLLIVPGQGSFVLLGAVVTTLALAPDAPITERCGACTRCLDACPTQAFPRPFVLDARRCVSYLTIERRDAIDEALAPGVGANLFGCDVCQEVCPFNASRRQTTLDPRPFEPLARWADLDLGDLLRLDEAGFVALTTGSPVRRATRDGLVRNACVVAANTGRRDLLPALLALAAGDPSPVVRAQAAAAAARLRAG
ncbi:MAG: tRNA epoxyqueuosine(34) reductase QueG [Polyangiaceae bacterium]|nr:tRNA epoxyqueuosine(34) reductase QueG [Polyangiaceae bacterium]